MDQSDEDIFQPVMNPLPPVVAVLCLAMFGIELVFWAGSRGR